MSSKLFNVSLLTMGIFLASFQSSIANAYTITFEEGLSLAKNVPLYHDRYYGRVGDFYLDEYGISFSNAIFLEVGKFPEIGSGGGWNSGTVWIDKEMPFVSVYSNIISFDFNSPVSAVTIWALGSWTGTNFPATLSALDANGVVIATDYYIGDPPTIPPHSYTFAVPLTVTVDGIRRIELIGGIAYDDLVVTPTTITPVPEPETYALFMAGLGLLGFIARRRKSDQA